MIRDAFRPLMGLTLLLALVGLTGCDQLEGLFGGDTETTGTVEEVGADFLVVDALRYTVTSATEFDGYANLAEVSVGDQVKVEYEDRSGERIAIAVEDPSAPDD